MAWRAGFPLAMTVPKPLRDARVIASLLVVAAAECPQRCLYDAPPAAPAAGADAAWEQSRAFDACGAWREASIDRAFGAWRCPMWETSHARFNCSAGAPYRAYRLPPCGDDERAFARRRADALARAFANRTTYFVGDSLSNQHWKDTICALLAPPVGGKLLELDAATATGAELDTYVVGHRCRVVRLPRARAASTLCHLTAGTVGGAAPTRAPPDARADELLRAGAARRRGDAFVLNDGLWYGEAEAAEVARLDALAARLARAESAIGGLARARAASVVWREVTPQAFADHPRGAHAPRSVRDGRACARPADGERGARRLGALRALSRRVEVALVWELAVSQWDAHIETRSEHARARGLDCTHYCEPSGVLAAVVDATALALLRADARAASPSS